MGDFSPMWQKLIRGGSISPKQKMKWHSGQHHLLPVPLESKFLMTEYSPKWGILSSYEPSNGGHSNKGLELLQKWEFSKWKDLFPQPKATWMIKVQGTRCLVQVMAASEVEMSQLGRHFWCHVLSNSSWNQGYKEQRVLLGVLEIAVWETQTCSKPKECSGEEKESRAYKGKSTRLLKLLCKNYDWLWCKKEIFALKG